MRSLWSDGTHEYVYVFHNRSCMMPLAQFFLFYFIIETNRKCPRWAEFNSSTVPTPSTPSTTSPAPTTANLPNLGFNRGPSTTTFGFPAAVPSPLATSPPMSAMDDLDAVPGTPSGSAPKIKLMLKRT